MEQTEIYVGSGNVFADMDLPHPEERLAKAEVAIRIQELIAERRLTQAEAATLMSASEAELIDIVRGHLRLFTLNLLFLCLTALGQSRPQIGDAAGNIKGTSGRRIKGLFGTSPMYLRFVVTQVDGHSKQPQGLFVAANGLLETGYLSEDEREQLKSVINWFNAHLPIPRRREVQGRATFWFIASAQECIQRMWSLVSLLRLHDYLVEVHKCDHLHNIVYRDQFQVAAYPHQYDGRRTVK